MSLLKAIKAQLGLSTTPANNFTLDASADNGTMKLARGNAGATTQDIITVDAGGKVAFPQQGQTLAVQGYVRLPGGLLIQWGSSTSSASADVTVTFPVAFSSRYSCVVQPRGGTVLIPTMDSSSPGTAGASMAVSLYTAAGARQTNGFEWFAIGQG